MGDFVLLLVSGHYAEVGRGAGGAGIPLLLQHHRLVSPRFNGDCDSGDEQRGRGRVYWNLLGGKSPTVGSFQLCRRSAGDFNR